MFSYFTLDGFEIKFASTCKVNGPLQENGLSFGCCSIWASIDGGKTYICIDERSNLKVKANIENNTLQGFMSIYNINNKE